MNNWIDFSVEKPKYRGMYLIAWRLNKDYDYVISLAYWERNIAKSYPFKYYDDYKQRKGGGWVHGTPEGDYEITGVEYWAKILPLPDKG